MALYLQSLEAHSEIVLCIGIWEYLCSTTIEPDLYTLSVREHLVAVKGSGYSLGLLKSNRLTF